MASTCSTTILFVLLVPAVTSSNLGNVLDDILNTVFNTLPAPVETVQRNDLNCYSCAGEPKSRQHVKCCACNSYAKWAGHEENLDIEYIDVFGRSLVVPEDDVKNGSVYKVELQDGEMGEIPSNLCNWDMSQGIHRYFEDKTGNSGAVDLFWDKLVKISFTRNRIRQLVDLNCLSRLDTLELGYNRITYVSNSSFNTLTHLRVLNLEHNWINVMDPSVLTNPSLHLSSVQLKNNKLNELDVSNCLSLYPFCDIDYSHNSIDTLTNVQDITLDTDVTYGPGYVNLQFNKCTTFPDLTTLLHMDSIQQLGQLLEFGFDLRNVPIVCDGRIEPYLAVARQLPENFWRNYMDVECAGPEELKGQLLKDVDLDDLVTNHNDCYLSCHCQERPSQNNVYIDCSGKGITDISKAPLPKFRFCENILLNVSNNNINIVENVANLDKVRVLDLTNNDVTGIVHEAANSLNNMTLIMKNNTNLKTIPEELRYIGFCNIHSESILECDCDSTWMSDWSRKSDCGNNQTTPFKCNVRNHGVMSMNKFDKNMLDCDTYDSYITELAVLLAAFLLVILVTAIITNQLRYELLILFLRLRRSKTNQVLPSFKYDAYFSFDEEDVGIRKWVNTELIPQLEDKGYQNFLSYRDLDIGSIRDNETIDVLTKTRNFVVILSQSYLDQEDRCWTDREWKHGWHMYKADSHKNIVLINYDHISSFDVGHPQIKAFLRVGGQVDFTNQSRDIIEHISKKLGPPIPKVTCTKQSFVNQKSRFDVTNLFLVDHLRSKNDPLKEIDEDTDSTVDVSDVQEPKFVFSNDRYSFPIKDYSKPVFDFKRYQ